MRKVVDDSEAPQMITLKSSKKKSLREQQTSLFTFEILDYQGTANTKHSSDAKDCSTKKKSPKLRRDESDC